MTPLPSAQPLPPGREATGAARPSPEAGVSPRLDRSDAWTAGLMLTLLAAFYGWFSFGNHGYAYDPNVYLSGAKSFALHGWDYRFEDYVDRPKIGLYPPMQSLYLSLFWRLNPDFPANACVLVTAMLLAALAAALAGYLLLRFQRVPRPVAAALTLLWSTSTVWIITMMDLMSDIGFTALILAAFAVAAAPQETDDDAPRWKLVLGGALLGLACLWRTAGVPVALIAMAFAAWRLRRSRDVAGFVALALPTFLAVAAARLANRGGFQYADAFREILKHEPSVLQGVARAARANAVEFATGRPLCQTLFSPLHRMQVSRDLAAGAGAARAACFIGFLAGAALAWRGWRLRTNPNRLLISLAAAGYAAFVVAAPNPPTDGARYFYPVTPILLGWAWLGAADLAKGRSRTLLPAAASIACAVATAGNLYIDHLTHRFWAKRFDLKDLREAAVWFAAHTPSGTPIAADWSIPVLQFSAWSGRPILADYFKTNRLYSPVTRAQQRSLPAQFVLVGKQGMPPYNPPAAFRPVFTAADGQFVIYQTPEAAP